MMRDLVLNAGHFLTSTPAPAPADIRAEQEVTVVKSYNFTVPGFHDVVLRG